MNYVLDALTMKEADQYTILTLNIPSLKLMENAGEAIFSYIKNNIHGSKNYKYLILTGSGNNGGDGFVVGRKLLEENYKVDIFEVYKAKSNDCLYNKKLFKKDTLCDIKLLDKLINKDTIVIDAIFGYGLNKNLDEYCSNFIKKVNSLEKKLLIAVDIASGINSTTGLKMNEAIISDITLTLGEAKLGLFINDGKEYPAVGISFGLSTVYEILKDNSINNFSETDIYIIPMDTEIESIKLANRLRNLNYNVEIDMLKRKLKKSLDYANKVKIPYVIILGETEVTEKKFKLKNMYTGKETIIELYNLDRITQIINQNI